MELLINKLNVESFSIILLGISFLISYFMIPKLIGVIRFKKLMDDPNVRSSHINKTPTLAGLVFFVSMIICLFIIRYFDSMDISLNIIVGLTILLIIGLKDDLVVLSVKAKVISQLFAITFILLNQDVHFNNFHGFLGITEIPLILTISLSYLYMMFIINAYNLIDGIDGLAAMLGIIIFSIFALLFYKIELNFYFLLSITSIGFLVAFLRYNLSKKNKIFMGDTGSMIVGFLIGILTLRFLALDIAQLESINVLPQNIFVVTLSVLFFPAIDVIRVIIIRLINNTGAFSPDRRHLHHVFIDKGLPHIRASLTISASSIFAFSIIYLANTFLSYKWLMVLFLFNTFITYYLLILLDTDPIMRVHRKKVKSFIPKGIYKLEFRIRKGVIIFLKKVFYKDLL